MKKIVTFEKFTAFNESLKNSNDSEYDIIFTELDSIEESLENKLNEGLIGQVLGWTFLPLLMLIRQGYRSWKKKKKIYKMLSNPKLSPEQKEKLREQLKGLKYEEVKAKEKVEQKKEELEEKIKAAKADMTPEEKKKYQKQADKKRKELRKAQDKLDKEMSKFHGLEV